MTLHIVEKGVFIDKTVKFIDNIIGCISQSLIVKGLDNLEVGIFEINPANPNHLPKMKSMLEDWLVGMGVQKEDITIVETGLPATTKLYIDKILEPIK